MNKHRIVILMGSMVAAVCMTVSAQGADFGLFGSYWDTDEGDEALGIGGTGRDGDFYWIRCDLA